MPYNGNAFEVRSAQPGVVLFTGTLTNSGGTILSSNPKVGVSTIGSGEYRLTVAGVGDLDFTDIQLSPYSTFPSPYEALGYAQQPLISSVSGNTIDFKMLTSPAGLQATTSPRVVGDALATDATAEYVVFAPRSGAGVDNLLINGFWFVPNASMGAVNGTDYATFTFRVYDSLGALRHTAVAYVFNGSTSLATIAQFGRLLMGGLSNVELSASDTVTLQISKAGAGVNVPTGTFGMDYYGNAVSSISAFDTVYYSIAVKNGSGF